VAAVFGNQRAQEKVEIRTLLKPVSITTIRNWQAARRWEPTWRSGVGSTTPDLAETPQQRCVPASIANPVASSSWLHHGWGAPGHLHPGRARLSSPGAPAP